MNLWFYDGDQKVEQREKTENKLEDSVKVSGARLASMKKRTENRGTKKEDWQWKSEERQTWTLDRHAREGEGAEEVSFPNPLAHESRLVE